MEKRAILAIVLSLIVVAAWSLFVAPVTRPPSEKPSPNMTEGGSAPPATTGQVRPTTPASPAPLAESPSVPVATEEKLVVVDTGVSRLTLTSQGAGVKLVQLHAYHSTLGKDASPIEIAPAAVTPRTPLTTELHLEQRVIALGQVAFTSAQTALTLSAGQPEGTVTFRGQLSEGVMVERTYRFQHGRYSFDVATTVEGLQAPAGSSMHTLWGPGLLHVAETTTRQGQTPEQAWRYVQGKLLQESPKKTGDVQIDSGQVTWAALADTYFTAVLIPREPAATATSTREVDKHVFEVGVRTPLGPDRAAQTLRVYVGPKVQPLLEEAEPSLGKVIDLGYFSPLARPMLHLLRFLNGLVHNYGITIMLATVLIKLAFWPLTQASYKSMQAMQKLQPRLKELQVVYKDDRQALNRAMMQLYRDNKVNPMGGCLPMVLQIPVFFAFYNALLYAIELRHAPFVCWETSVWWVGRGVCDLSVADPSYITPVLMGVTMFIQQKMTPTMGDPTQAKIMQFMPLMFLMFFLNAPAGLVIYWLVNNVLSIGQQLMINRMATAGKAPVGSAR